MKRITALISLIILFLIVFNSCKKNETAPAQSISFDYNGTHYSSSSPVTTFGKIENLMTITTSFDSTTELYLLVTLNNEKTGDYAIGGFNVSAFFAKNAKTFDLYHAKSGNISVTSFTSKSISGAFQFIEFDSNIVSNGTFQVNYKSN